MLASALAERGSSSTQNFPGLVPEASRSEIPAQRRLTGWQTASSSAPWCRTHAAEAVSGVCGAKQLAEFLCDDALHRRSCTATRALGMSFFLDGPES